MRGDERRPRRDVCRLDSDDQEQNETEEEEKDEQREEEMRKWRRVTTVDGENASWSLSLAFNRWSRWRGLGGSMWGELW
jgi:hypothetical protein